MKSFGNGAKNMPQNKTDKPDKPLLELREPFPSSYGASTKQIQAWCKKIIKREEKQCKNRDKVVENKRVL